jgi:hypothetical protein
MVTVPAAVGATADPVALTFTSFATGAAAP